MESNELLNIICCPSKWMRVFMLRMEFPDFSSWAQIKHHHTHDFIKNLNDSIENSDQSLACDFYSKTLGHSPWTDLYFVITKRKHFNASTNEQDARITKQGERSENLWF